MGRVYDTPTGGGRVYSAAPEPAAPQKGLFGSLVEGVATPFLRTAVTGIKAVGGLGYAGKALFQKATGDQKGAAATIKKGNDFAAPRPFDPSGKLGLFGTVSPLGAKDGEMLGLGDQVKDAAGTGTELGSYFLGGGEAKSIVQGAKDLRLSSRLFRGVTTGAGVGGAAGLGTGLQSTVKSDESAGSQAGSVALNTLVGSLAGGALGLAGEATAAGVKTAKNIFKPTPEFADTARQELTNSYARDLNLTKRQRTLQSRWGKDTPDFLAEESLYNPNIRLEKDGEGRLDTTKAVNEFKKMSKLENGAFNEILKAENKYVSLEDYRAQALKEIDTPANRAKGSEFENKQAHINKEIDALKRNLKSREGVIAEEGDLKMPLDIFNEVKQGRWATAKGFGNVSDVISNDTNFEMGQVAKNIIEDQLGSADAKAINRRLGDIAETIKVLNDRQGAVLPGGKLGRYTAMKVGAIAGISQGPAGSVVGALTAEKLAEVMQNPELSNGVKRWIITRVRGTPQFETVAQKAEKILGQKLEEAAARKALPPGRTIFQAAPKQSDSTKLFSSKEAGLINETRSGGPQTKMLPAPKTQYAPPTQNGKPVTPGPNYNLPWK